VIPPALGLALVLILFSASLHHALRGREAADLGYSALTALAGFVLGEWLAQAMRLPGPKIGLLHVLPAMGGAWALMLAVDEWRRRRSPRP
jgi:hypothetical protein